MSQPKHICGGLREEPDVAREIGLLIGDYSTLEWLLFQPYAMLSRLRPEEVFAAYFSQRSINRKAGLLEAEMWRLSPPLQTALKRLIRRMKGAAARRTELAHAHVLPGPAGPMRLHLFGEAVRIEPLDKDFINRTIHQFHTLGIDLLAFSAILGALAPDILIPRLKKVYAPIDAHILRRPGPQGSEGQLAEDMRDESYKRLGLTAGLQSDLHISLSLEWPRINGVFG